MQYPGRSAIRQERTTLFLPTIDGTTARSHRSILRAGFLRDRSAGKTSKLPPHRHSSIQQHRGNGETLERLMGKTDRPMSHCIARRLPQASCVSNPQPDPQRQTTKKPLTVPWIALPQNWLICPYRRIRLSDRCHTLFVMLVFSTWH